MSKLALAATLRGVQKQGASANNCNTKVLSNELDTDERLLICNICKNI